MRISYNKLWKLLIDRGLKKKDVCELANISSSSMAKMGRNENVSLDVLLKICEALNCDICEIIGTERESNEKEI